SKVHALPEFPTRIASGSFLAATVAVLAVILKDGGSAEIWLAIFALAVLFAAAVIWLWRAPALDDLALVPALALLAAVVLQASGGHLFRDFQSGLSRVPESSPPATVTVLAMLALGASLLAFLRSHQGKRHLMIWAAGSALFSPLVLILLEVFWSPAEVLGDGYWAGHAMIVAAAMVFFAERTIRLDSGNRDRTAGFILAALTMISFALIIILSDAALTIALGFMTLVAAWLDRTMDVKRLSLFVRLGAIVTGVRLAIYPGPEWAFYAPVWEFGFAYLGTAGLIAAAWVIESAKHRPGTRVILESAIWVIVPVFASVALLRAMGSYDDTHFAISLLGSIWLISAFGQLYRIKAGGKMKWVRITLASLAGLGALLFFFVGLVIMNPLSYFGDRVIGPPIIDSLAVAFLWPALIMAIGALKLDHLYRWFRLTLAGTASILSAAYVGLEIRRLWRGDNLSVPGVIQSENISYTLAMLLVSVVLLFYAFGRRSKPLRRIAVIGIGLTIAKVFLIDMSGLVGLYRVVSFLGLGLSLSGLAWVDRQMARQWDRGSKSAE
ncbi:MAG: DUF2339 domain-containing protein, partial [Paracoccaceae bacterium]|nr:DUF2339 domain-containing protein [Paracoccaceae bacterium]